MRIPVAQRHFEKLKHAAPCILRCVSEIHFWSRVVLKRVTGVLINVKIVLDMVLFESDNQAINLVEWNDVVMIAIKAQDGRLNIANKSDGRRHAFAFGLEYAAAIENDGGFHLRHDGGAEKGRAATHAVADNAKGICADRWLAREKVRGRTQVGDDVGVTHGFARLLPGLFGRPAVIHIRDGDDEAAGS